MPAGWRPGSRSEQATAQASRPSSGRGPSRRSWKDVDDIECIDLEADEALRRDPAFSLAVVPANNDDHPRPRGSSSSPGGRASPKAGERPLSRGEALTGLPVRAPSIHPPSLTRSQSPSQSPRNSRDASVSPSSQRDTEPLRALIRSSLVEAAGSEEEAFRQLDLNGSGSVSMQEFVDGFERLRINWQELCGLSRKIELMRLFDVNRDGTLGLKEIFPSTASRRKDVDHSRRDTAELWGMWCDKNPDPSTMSRGPMWRPAGLDDMLARQAKGNWVFEEVNARRKWISRHFRLLKKTGKSNQRCRQWIAHHLPGNNARSRTSVEAFVRADATKSRQSYLDEVNEPAHNIRTVVNDMREQRKALASSRKKLWSVVEEPYLRQKAEEEMQAKTAQLALALGGGGKNGGQTLQEAS
eukprot:TRINITY_DN19464_c0_g2_i1.p1 TRINITY_DN19464_c0_g2~~TRINITY_DN19464_c0_g2_i1.p1  ORF type:complete len:412 (+),score=80.76 TRINITY_DN19464_c0_g2_i1:55-1290(+)